MTTMADMGRIRVRLPLVMAEHRIKQVHLSEAAGVRNATINAMYNDTAKRLDYDTLVRVIEGLKKLTGRTYSVGELLEYVDDLPEQQN